MRFYDFTQLFSTTQEILAAPLKATVQILEICTDIANERKIATGLAGELTELFVSPNGLVYGTLCGEVVIFGGIIDRVFCSDILHTLKKELGYHNYNLLPENKVVANTTTSLEVMKNILANSTIEGKTLFIKEGFFLGFGKILRDLSNPFQNSTKEASFYLRKFVNDRHLQGVKIKYS